MAIFLRRLLEDQFTVEVKSNRRETLQWLEGNTPALIIMDLDMPHTDGFDLLQNIQGISHLSDTSVLVLSGNTMSHIPVQCFKLGAKEYLTKPFNPDELQVRLEKLNVQERPPPPSSRG